MRIERPKLFFKTGYAMEISKSTCILVFLFWGKQVRRNISPIIECSTPQQGFLFFLQIERLRIGHDGSGMGSGWFLDKVEVEVDTRGEIYEFTCHRWLDKGEMDGRIEIDLYPTQITTTQPSKPISILSLTK